ncbi:MAG: hypothetical protein IJ053_00375 [Lachnospiraceae bacterium]|nr:hypothetical protein [Lachnospiraceae bacterium]
MTIISIMYIIAGYWAANRTVYKNYVIVGDNVMNIFVRKIVVALLLGWILIPIAIVMTILGK